VNASSTYYMAEAYGSQGKATLSLYRNQGGAFTKLADVKLASITGTLRLEAVGNSLKVFLDGKVKLFANDNVLTAAGGVGMRGTSGGALDNFSYERLTAAAAVLSFKDDFATAGANAQLRNVYAEKVGNFKVEGGQVSNNASSSVAVLNGVSKADVVVKADVSVAAGSGHSVGLVARYNGDGEGSGYLAEMYGKPGVNGVVVNIYRRQGGTLTQLGSAVTADGQGALAFTAFGSTLTLTMNGKSLLQVRDTTIAAGSAGVRVNGAAKLDNLDVSAATSSPPAPPAPPTPTPNTNPTTGNPKGHDNHSSLPPRVVPPRPREDPPIVVRTLPDGSRYSGLDDIFISRLF